MLLLIANAFFLAAGIVLVAFQTVEITSKRVKPAMKLKVFSITGYLLALVAIISGTLCVLASRPLLLSDDLKTILIALVVAFTMYAAFIVVWFWQKRILVKTVFDNRKPQPRDSYFRGLTERFLNLAIYGLLYAFAIMFFVIVLMSYLNGN